MSKCLQQLTCDPSWVTNTPSSVVKVLINLCVLPLRTWLITKHAFIKPESIQLLLSVVTSYCVSPIHSFPISISNTQILQWNNFTHTLLTLYVEQE